MPGELASAGEKILASLGKPNWLSRAGKASASSEQKHVSKEEKVGRVCSPLCTSSQLAEHRYSLSGSLLLSAFSP